MYKDVKFKFLNSDVIYKLLIEYFLEFRNKLYKFRSLKSKQKKVPKCSFIKKRNILEIQKTHSFGKLLYPV